MDNITKAAIIFGHENTETVGQTKSRLLDAMLPSELIDAGAFIFGLGYKYDGSASPEMVDEFWTSPHGTVSPLNWIGSSQSFHKEFAEYWMSNYRRFRERV